MGQPAYLNRFAEVTEDKAEGVTYTPARLADFVADQIGTAASPRPSGAVRVLDPAVGEGELLLSMVTRLKRGGFERIEAFGYDTDTKALAEAETRLKRSFPDVATHFAPSNFLEFVLDNYTDEAQPSLFGNQSKEKYDLIIANPPYIRTQVMGAARAQQIGRQFGLTGRVDLYYAFLIAIGRVLEANGTAGVIVSNRFMTTRSGESVRRALRDHYNVAHIWDFGDTKLFDAAVLPAVLLVEGKGKCSSTPPKFTSIYETTEPATVKSADPIDALAHEGVVEVRSGRRFLVQHGTLSQTEGPGAVWRITSQKGDVWLASVEANKWGTFRDIGKVRVGVKTCADKIFIRNDWDKIPEADRPELLKPLSTHHIARRYKALDSSKRYQIVYPHIVRDGVRRAVDLASYPRTKVYLEGFRSVLEGRQYVLKAGRAWHEIWVPQDPAAWAKPKLVFRDISEEPVFWVDLDGSVVNGDCYWLTCDSLKSENLLWLACAIANSKFIEAYYDKMFNNKLYAGRRRFITQYVERFPLPDPTSKIGREIISKARTMYDSVETPEAFKTAAELEELVCKAFGL